MLILGVLKTNASGALDDSSWEFANAADGVTYTAENGAVDLRHINRLLLDTTLIDDSKLVFKDRDSTGTSALTGEMELTKSLIVKNDVTIGDDLTVSGLIIVNGQEDSQLAIGTSSPLGGLPLSVSNAHGVQSKDAGGNGHVAHFYGDTSRLTIRERDQVPAYDLTTDAIEIYNYDPTTTLYKDLRLGRTMTTDETI
jgi:hypothetical protein